MGALIGDPSMRRRTTCPSPMACSRSTRSSPWHSHISTRPTRARTATEDEADHPRALATSSVLVAVALAAAVVTACGNGDDSTPTPPDSGASDGAKTEGGDAARSDASGVGDAPGPETDAGASPDAGDATLASDASDAGDAGDASDAHDAADGAVACNFATFVRPRLRQRGKAGSTTSSFDRVAVTLARTTKFPGRPI